MAPVLTERWIPRPASSRYTKLGYDYESHKTFEYYPSTRAASRRSHHHLRRPRPADEEGQHRGTTLQQIAYLSGNRQQVRTASQQHNHHQLPGLRPAWLQYPVQIVAPQSQTPPSARPLRPHPVVTQSGGGASATRSYTYDAYYRLCRRTEPRIRLHLWGYDSASEIVWQAEGQSGSGCLSAAPSGATLYQYDTMGRKPPRTTTLHGRGRDLGLRPDAASPPSATPRRHPHLQLQPSRPAVAEPAFSHHLQLRYPGPRRAVRHAGQHHAHIRPDAWGRARRSAHYHQRPTLPDRPRERLRHGQRRSTTAPPGQPPALYTQTVTRGSTLQSLTYTTTTTTTSPHHDNAGGTTPPAWLRRPAPLTTASNTSGQLHLWLRRPQQPQDPHRLLRADLHLQHHHQPAEQRQRRCDRSYGYDSRGRPSGDGTRSYTWNDADEMTASPAWRPLLLSRHRQAHLLGKANGDTTCDVYDASGALGVQPDLPRSERQLDQLRLPDPGRTGGGQINDGTPHLPAPGTCWARRGWPRTATGTIAWQEHYAPMGPS